MTTHICPITRSRRAGALVALLAAALTLQSCHTASADTRAGANAPGRPSWSHAVHGWPSSIVTDRRGLVVLSGGAAVTDLDGGGARRWTTRVDGLTGTDPALSETSVVNDIVDRGVIVRDLWTATTIGSAYTGPLISIPPLLQAPRQLSLTAQIAGVSVLRAEVQFTDSAGTANGSVPHVLTWSQQ